MPHFETRHSLRHRIPFDVGESPMCNLDAPYKNSSLNSGGQLVSEPDSMDLKHYCLRPDGHTIPRQMNDGFRGIGPFGDGP